MTLNPGSAANTVFKSYSLGDIGNSGTHYFGGWYEAPEAHFVSNQGALTQTVGSAANEAKGAHVFIVASAAGAATGGSTGEALITVTGVSITDAGVKNDSDSEVLLADVSTASTNAYYETTKKWLGQPIITLSQNGDRTSYNLTYNYGYTKYEDFGNRNFTITDFEVTGHGGASETGLQLGLLHHNATDWTYSAAAFDPAAGKFVVTSATDYGTNNNLTSDEDFAYKRAGLSTFVNGDNGEGTIVCIITAINNSIDYASIHVGVNF